jgi:hypothetical protein
MSTLLDEIIALRKAKAIEFNEFLKRMGTMWRSGYRQVALTKIRYNWIPLGKLALYNNLKASPKMQGAEKAGFYAKTATIP